MCDLGEVVGVTVVVCEGCGVALTVSKRFVSLGNVTPEGADVLLVATHDCPRSIEQLTG